jgi:di/tricarboxylate transporter
LNKNRKLVFGYKIFKQNEILRVKTEVLMINKRVHMINSLVNDQSILLLINQIFFLDWLMMIQNKKLSKYLKLKWIKSFYEFLLVLRNNM